MPFRFIAELIGFIASVVTIVSAIIGCIKFFVHKKKSRSVCQQSGNVSHNGK
ncbi:MAG: hypothetical protein J6M24_02210 [Lachnospiraceae bacterium]|nr:hypothetical protein [Lachnospiraceae bacterium]